MTSTHGHRRGPDGRPSPTYTTWRCMRRRCYDRKHPSYPDYGGRGVRVYFGWMGRGGFEEFLRDVGPRPKGCTLDRIDRDGHYEPGNVRWATIRQQNAGLLDQSGRIVKGKTLAQWAKSFGIQYTSLRRRILRKGMKAALEQGKGRAA